MQSDTRIFVFRLRQLLTFLLVLIILIAAAVFILFVISSSKKDVQTSPASAYTAGVYTSSITLNNQSVDIQVVVDKDHIKSASIVNLDESVAAMYPLLTTSMDAPSPRSWPPASPSMISVTNRPAAILHRYFSVPSPRRSTRPADHLPSTRQSHPVPASRVSRRHHSAYADPLLEKPQQNPPSDHPAGMSA